MISGISKIISAAALTLMVFTGAQAKPSVSEQNIKTKAKEDTVMTMSRATLLVPRPALEPVKSIDPSSAAPIDTMDTGNPAVKILLMANHTWKYYKDPSISSHSEIFNRYWSDEYPNPYKMDLKDLNDDISIWVVDTLNMIVLTRLRYILLSVTDTGAGTWVWIFLSRRGLLSWLLSQERSECQSITEVTAILWLSVTRVAWRLSMVISRRGL